MVQDHTFGFLFHAVDVLSCLISAGNMFFVTCFCPWTFFQNIEFIMVPSDPFVSHLATQLGYSAGEFQALQLSVLATFGVVVNHLLPACWSTFWKSIFKQQLGNRFDIMGSISSFFCILTYAIIYVSIHHIVFWLYPYFLNIIYFLKYSCSNIFHRRSLWTFYQYTVTVPVSQHLLTREENRSLRGKHKNR